MTDASAGTTVAKGRNIQLIRWLTAVNLVLVVLQPISAGLFMSGFGRALPAHAAVGLALMAVLLVQTGASVLVWRQGRAPAWVAGIGVALFVAVLLQNTFGRNRQYWLHVPMGVGLVAALNRQRRGLDAL